MQTTLTLSDYVRPGCDCQSISVSQYLPGVIRVDGVINKGKLQVCMKPPPSGFHSVVTNNTQANHITSYDRLQTNG